MLATAALLVPGTVAVAGAPVRVVPQSTAQDFAAAEEAGAPADALEEQSSLEPYIQKVNAIVQTSDGSGYAGLYVNVIPADELTRNSTMPVELLAPNVKAATTYPLGSLIVYWKGAVPESISSVTENAAEHGVNVITASAAFSLSELKLAAAETDKQADAIMSAGNTVQSVFPYFDGSGLGVWINGAEPSASSLKQVSLATSEVPTIVGYAPNARGVLTSGRFNDASR